MCNVLFQSRTSIPVLPSFCYVLMCIMMSARALVLPSMCNVLFQSRTSIPVLPSFCYVLMCIMMSTRALVLPSMCNVLFQSRTSIPVLPSPYCVLEIRCTFWAAVRFAKCLSIPLKATSITQPFNKFAFAKNILPQFLQQR